MQFQSQIIVLKDQNNYNNKTDQIKFNNFIDSNIYSANNQNDLNNEQNDDTDNLSDFDNFDLFDVTDRKSKDHDQLKLKIVKLLNENDAACGNDSNRSKKSRKHQQQIIEHLNESRIFAKQHLALKVNHKPSKICLFRKATIVILAAHRLIYFHNYNLNTGLSVFDSVETRHRFIFSQPNSITKFQIKKPDYKCKS